MLRDRRPSPPTDHLRSVQQTAYLTLELAKRLQDNYAGHAAAHDLTAAQAGVLQALQPGAALSQRALADQLKQDPSNLTGLIDKLEARGAVRRRPDPDDRRVKLIELTTAGSKTRQAFWKTLTTDAGPLAHLTTAEIASLLAGLQRALDRPDPHRGQT